MASLFGGTRWGMATGSATAQTQVRRAANSKALAAAARAGFVGRGVIYTLIGILSLRIAFSGEDEQADRGGAIAEIAQKPFGTPLLWLLGTTLAGMTLWRLSEAAFGQAGPDGDKPGKRATATGRALFYAFVTYSVLRCHTRCRQPRSAARLWAASRLGSSRASHCTASAWVVGRCGRQPGTGSPSR